MAAAVPKVSGLNCPNCGAALELRSFAHALSIVCPSCLSVLDAKDPNLQILQEAQSRERYNPLIPLGSRGTLASGTYEAIGFQIRTIYDEGQSYSWSEYLLFNPYKGFRYLTEYNGHWNDVHSLHTVPQPLGSNQFQVGADRFKMFSNAMAVTTFVLGEFPWQVHVGEQVQTTDYIAPPRILSAETTINEITWSQGDYVSSEQIAQAFKLSEKLSAPRGIYANQPSPFTGTTGSVWATSLKLMLAALVVAVLIYVMGSNKILYQQSFTSSAGSTSPFEVSGHTSGLELKTVNHTGEAIYIRYSLVNDRDGRTVEFGRQINSNYGQDNATIPSVAPGRYILRASAEAINGTPEGAFDVALSRARPSLGWLIGALVFLAIPPILQSLRASSFERSRWLESST
jgi:Domain of unknown function (DUF4178)